MRAELHTHPKIVRMASALKADRLRIVGGLHAVWCLFDTHSEDGHLTGYTSDALDELIGFSGFAKAMECIGWLRIEPDALLLPNFDEHNGQSAKRRAMDAQRKRNDRAQSVHEMSAPNADKKRTREEKRREDKTPQTPAGFARFWLTWPKSLRKEAKGKCLEAWVKAGAEEQADAIIAHVESLKKSAMWTKDAGQFIPAPLVYLNQRRWEGAEAQDDDPFGLRRAA